MEGRESVVVLSSLSLEGFRLFSKLSIENITMKHLIMGPNGSGKTSVFWAVLLLLRAFNARTRASQTWQGKAITMSAKDLGRLLNYTALETMTGFTEFIHMAPEQREDPKRAHFFATILGVPFSCDINANGVITLKPKEENCVAESKIRFAFMGPDAHFTNPEDEASPENNPILSSQIALPRARYRKLSREYQDQLQRHLKSLFSVKDLKEGKVNSLYVEEPHGHCVEVMFTGAAFRKVFTALVLLYTIVANEASRRVFLIEEPEALLYPVLLKQFCAVLIQVANDFNVQLLITSNSPIVKEFFTEKETFVLIGGDKPNRGHHLHNRKWLREAVDLHLLGLSAKPLIVCEGSDDDIFLKKLAPLLNKVVDLSKVQLRASSSLCSNPELRKHFTQLAADLNVPSVIFVRDLDFRINVQPGKQEEEGVFFWDLPSIESYLFLYHCTKQSQQGGSESPLAFLRDEVHEQRFATKYANSFRSQNPKGGESNIHLMMRNWNRALQAANKDNPATEDFLAVAKVLRGHTWVKHVRNATTPQLINLVGSDIASLCPQLKERFDELWQMCGLQTTLEINK